MSDEAHDRIAAAIKASSLSDQLFRLSACSCKPVVARGAPSRDRTVMIGQLLVGAMALIMGLIAYGFLWLRLLWLRGRKPTTDDILDYGPPLIGAAFFIIIAVTVQYAIVAGLIHILFGIALWPY